MDPTRRGENVVNSNEESAPEIAVGTVCMSHNDDEHATDVVVVNDGLNRAGTSVDGEITLEVDAVGELLGDTDEEQVVEANGDETTAQQGDGEESLSAPQPPPLKEAKDVAHEGMAPLPPGAVFQRRLSASSHGGSVGDAPIVNAELVHDNPASPDPPIVMVNTAHPVVEASAISERAVPSEHHQEGYMALLGKRRVLCLLFLVAVAVAAVVIVTVVLVTGTSGDSSSNDEPASRDRAAYVDDDSDSCNQCTDSLNVCDGIAATRCLELQKICESPCLEIDDEDEAPRQCLNDCRTEAEACVLDYTTNVCDAAFDACQVEFC